MNKFTDCCLCPRNCHVDRTQGKTGYCGQTDQIRAARAALHMWEEPAYPVMRDPEPCFFRAVRLAVCSVRTSPLLQAVWGKQFPWNGWQKYF